MNRTALRCAGRPRPAWSADAPASTRAASPSATITLDEPFTPHLPEQDTKHPTSRRSAAQVSTERWEGSRVRGGLPGLSGGLDREGEDVGGALQARVLAGGLVLVHVVVGAHHEILEP